MSAEEMIETGLLESKAEANSGRKNTNWVNIRTAIVSTITILGVLWGMGYNYVESTEKSRDRSIAASKESTAAAVTAALAAQDVQNTLSDHGKQISAIRNDIYEIRHEIHAISERSMYAARQIK